MNQKDIISPYAQSVMKFMHKKIGAEAPLNISRTDEDTQ